MRRLNLLELEQKVQQYTTDIEYSNIQTIDEKITQFIYFLDDQTISNRILDRIDNDFKYIKESLPPYEHNNISYNIKESILSSIKSREQQGAFGYFLIRQFYSIEKKYTHHYISVIQRWYNVGGNYNDHKDRFIDKFFTPFIELLEWYIYESETKDEKDYFSKAGIEEMMSKLDELEEKMNLHNLQRDNGQQLIFEEIEELKELILILNKKNWEQIFKGKMGDLILGSIITTENASVFYNFIKESGILPSLNG